MCARWCDNEINDPSLTTATEVQRVAIDDEQRTSDSDSCHDKDS